MVHHLYLAVTAVFVFIIHLTTDDRILGSVNFTMSSTLSERHESQKHVCRTKVLQTHSGNQSVSGLYRNVTLEKHIMVTISFCLNRTICYLNITLSLAMNLTVFRF